MLYCLLLVVAIIGIAMSDMFSPYDYDWTPEIPDQVDRDAVAALSLLAILGAASAIGSLILKWRSIYAWVPGIVLVIVGIIRIVELSRL